MFVLVWLFVVTIMRITEEVSHYRNKSVAVVRICAHLLNDAVVWFCLRTVNTMRKFTSREKKSKNFHVFVDGRK